MYCGWRRNRCAIATPLWERTIAVWRKGKEQTLPHLPHFAVARKLATLAYRLLRWGQPYVDEGAEAYEKRYQQQRIRSLQSRAKQMGYQLTPLIA